jgi:hypothetical protein
VTWAPGAARRAAAPTDVLSLLLGLHTPRTNERFDEAPGEAVPFGLLL